MDDNHSVFNKLVNDLILYHQDLGLAICQPCQVAFPKDIERHFQNYHKSVTVSERRSLTHYIKSLPGKQEVDVIRTSLATEVEREAIKGLKIINGLKCNVCHFFGGNSRVERHCRSHSWVVGQRTFYLVLN